MSSLIHVERQPTAEAEGLLILHHGRGSNEHDLIGLADVLDPDGRLHVVSPRAPLLLEGWPGHHWYIVQRVGHPHEESFHAAYRTLADFHDALWDATGIGPEQTILGGFSMGSVMSFATGLGPGRPPVAGIMALSGFVPTVEGWAPEFIGREDTRVLIAHGRQDPVIPIEFAHQARTLIDASPLELEYMESDAGHNIDPRQIPLIVDWVDRTLAP
jgi:phospholipase/carboxylesterase